MPVSWRHLVVGPSTRHQRRIAIDSSGLRCVSSFARVRSGSDDGYCAGLRFRSSAETRTVALPTQSTNPTTCANGTDLHNNNEYSIENKTRPIEGRGGGYPVTVGEATGRETWGRNREASERNRQNSHFEKENDRDPNADASTCRSLKGSGHHKETR